MTMMMIELVVSIRMVGLTKNKEVVLRNLAWNRSTSVQIRN